MSNNCENHTLRFLTNPIYKPDVKNESKKTDINYVNNYEKKFYKKRIISMTKELFKKRRIIRKSMTLLKITYLV